VSSVYRSELAPSCGFAVSELGGILPRPSRTDEPHQQSPPIGKIRQPIESIVNSLKDQLWLEPHLAKTPAGLTCRITSRILAHWS
jgi:hypothetical protein